MVMVVVVCGSGRRTMYHCGSASLWVMEWCGVAFDGGSMAFDRSTNDTTVYLPQRDSERVVNQNHISDIEHILHVCTPANLFCGGQQLNTFHLTTSTTTTKHTCTRHTATFVLRYNNNKYVFCICICLYLIVIYIC